MEAVPYPALTLAGAGASQTRELAGTGLTRAVSVMELPRMGDAIQVASLAQGGRAARRQGAGDPQHREAGAGSVPGAG